MRERLGELVGGEALAPGSRLVACGVQLDQFGDAGVAGLVESRVWLGQGVEPLEVSWVGTGRERPGLTLIPRRNQLLSNELPSAVAGVRQELGVLLEDLEVLLLHASQVTWVDGLVA